MNGIISLDIGTSSVKGITYNDQGSCVFKTQRSFEHSVENDQIVEQSSGIWHSYVDSILIETGKFCAANDIQISAVSLTSQRSSVIPVDRDGNSLYNTIMWYDRRTADLCQELTVFNDEVYRISGLVISPVFSAVKILWFKRNLPDVYEKTYKMLGIHDYILHFLTGRFVTDESFASRTNLFDLEKRQWSERLAGIFDVDIDKLCEVVRPGTSCGSLRIELAERYGFINDVNVVSAGGDQQCSALGLGVFSKGSVEITTGTGGFIIAHSDHPVLDKERRISCNISAIPGKYIVEASILTSGVIYDWFNRQCFDENNFDKIDKSVMDSPVGAKGVLLLPHFKGAGSPKWDPDAKGVFYDLSLNTTKGDMARSILEGIAMEAADSLEIIEELCGNISRISVSGGLTKFDEYDHIMADVFGKEIIRYASSDATALGAWISAAAAIGSFRSQEEAYERYAGSADIEIFVPNEENTKIYRENILRKNALYDALTKIRKLLYKENQR